jgi:hypothetical protein
MTLLFIAVIPSSRRLAGIARILGGIAGLFGGLGFGLGLLFRVRLRAFFGRRFLSGGLLGRRLLRGGLLDRRLLGSSFLGGSLLGRGFLGGSRLGRGFLGGRLRFGGSALQGGGERKLDVRLALLGIADQHPAAGGAGHRAADQDQSPVLVGRDHLQVLHRGAGVAHMAGHLLALPHLAGLLAVAGRAVAAVRDRDAVTGPQAGEVVPFHGPRKALADAGADHVHELAGDEMRGGQLGADIQHRVAADPELGQLALRLDPGLGEMAAAGACDVLHLGIGGAKLQGGIPVLFLSPDRDNLAVVNLQHGHRHMFAGLVEDPRHSQFLSDQSSAHGAFIPRA